ncbi:MAG: CHASE2 domain-containing serine/threonine-protein kinase [Desulfococcaceae bacterium]
MDILKKYPAICLGAAITLLFLAMNLAGIGFFENLELAFYDLRMKYRDVPGDSDEILVVDIDDRSIEKLGRWPWPRSVIARGLEKIAQGKPKIIGLNVLYSEPEDSSGLKQIRTLIELVEKSGKSDPTLLKTMKLSLEELDNDSKLEAAIASAGNVVMPVSLKETSIQSGAGKEEDPELIQRSIAGGSVDTASGDARFADEILRPVPAFLKNAAGIGHVNMAYDTDGKVRGDILLYRYRDIYIPSFPLSLAAFYLDIPVEAIQARPGASIDLDKSVSIPVTRDTMLLAGFKGEENTFKSLSFSDILSGEIPSAVFQNKIVLITPTASGTLNPISTPTAQRMSVGEFTANIIWSVLHKQFIRKPGWDRYAGPALILLVGVLISLVLPRIKAAAAGLTFAAALAVLAGASFYLFKSAGIWMKVTYPVLQLIAGYIGAVSINFFVTEAGKEKVEGESAETNRMLGLSFQSQGMLDMAFDKFRKVPVDDPTKDLLYNLALDYERKRQYNKAASVYEYIEQHDPGYKNISQRKQKLLQASETMVFGDGFLTGTSGGDPLLSGGDTGTRPTLGRYEIMKQLGKGAMGIVYLGQDPRINRTTAIKTFRFTDDFEAEEAEKMKQKFFREAESAGKLSHPNIVSIYDAGDEHDLAYIAMEFLDGEDFQKYTKKKNLLPMRKVIDYVADIADALDYAHQNGIVHRDIKPANIMLLKSGVVKITDFGIARITATSQTQTGVVKGTPHYMSPEQISGKKVDGRSDIFSLGGMLYQLLTGELPFRGDSPAALMHQIMNVPHPDPKQYNPKIMAPLVTIIDRALEKDRNKRYQRAIHIAQHLRALGAKIDAIMAQKKSQQAKA